MRMKPLTPFLILAALVAAAAPARAADAIFNQGTLHELRIVMDPADWKSLRDNFRGNQYYAANISVDGEVLQQVGIRSRGYLSSGYTLVEDGVHAFDRLVARRYERAL